MSSGENTSDTSNTPNISASQAAEDDDDFTKVVVYLRGVGVGSESFWATELQQQDDGSTIGIVDNLLAFAPFRYGDAVRFVDDPSGRSRVVEVVARSRALWVEAGLFGEGPEDDEWLEDPVVQLDLITATQNAVGDVFTGGGRAAALGDRIVFAGFFPDAEDSRPIEDICVEYTEETFLPHFDPILDAAEAAGRSVILRWDLSSSPAHPLGDCGGIIDTNPGEAPPAPIADSEANLLVFGREDVGAGEAAPWFEMLEAAFQEGDLPRQLSFNPDGPARVIAQVVETVRLDPRARATLAAGRQYDVLLVAGRILSANLGLPLPPLSRSLLVSS